MLGRTKNTVTPDKLLIGHSRVVTGASAIAEELNRAFVDPVETPSLSQNDVDHNHRLEWSVRSMLLFDASDTEVFLLLSGLDTHKSTGPDGLANYILKNCASQLATPLTICINKSIRSGLYPDILKVARVTPVFKNGLKELAQNYRPISVLSGLNKIFETILATRFKNFLKTEGLLYEKQYGFRDKSGTSTAAMEMIDYVYEHLDQKGCNIVSALFIDLRKAFDSVKHNLLLRKLYAYVIRGPAYEIMSSYLSNRSQFVAIRGTNSSTLPITRGVPQGSVLGPLLFLYF